MNYTFRSFIRDVKSKNAFPYKTDLNLDKRNSNCNGKRPWRTILQV